MFDWCKVQFLLLTIDIFYKLKCFYQVSFSDCVAIFAIGSFQQQNSDSNFISLAENCNIKIMYFTLNQMMKNSCIQFKNNIVSH